ncbi:pyridoxal phosphate-dependent aminotransferase [Peribacillus glennii]|uniref:Aminotransferase n=1 Tax=Peribacillus glennii TaxID=2303991 RepID=A0A372LFS0_9BACI|nr:pyridoxal phosphate-dependent aminotransferase [Peribacillus glennii]RFU65143.1 pyridoxal phosphate-dependent aminotransferase [Peribacillus glennii]
MIAERAILIPNSAIRQFFNLAQGMENVNDLTIGAPDFETPEYIVKSAVKASLEGHHYYSANAGIMPLRKAIAAKLERDNGISYDPETEIDVTIGATEALGLLMMTLLNPGDEVILADPTWPNYITQILMAGGVPVRVPTFEKDGFSLQVDAVEEAITERTKAILINSPNNPTGAILDRESVKGFVELARKHGLYLISDEVYEKIIYDQNQHFSPASLPDTKDFVITVNSFSKSYAMCGWRVGYVAASEKVITPLLKLQEGMASCANTMAQMAAVTALEGPQDAVNEMVKRYRARRDLMVEGLNKIPGISVEKPGGAFYLFVNVKGLGKSSQEIATELLQKTGVMTVPGSGFGSAGEGFLRICYAKNDELLQKALERIHDVVIKDYCPA